MERTDIDATLARLAIDAHDVAAVVASAGRQSQVDPAALDRLGWILTRPIDELGNWDSASVQRGLDCVRRQAVHSVQVDAGERVITGTVVGQGITPYAVRCRVPRDPGLIHASCTCPVASDCKHGVAVIEVARVLLSAAGPGVPHTSWRDVLAPALATPQLAAPSQFRYGLHLVRQGDAQTWSLQLISRNTSGAWGKPVEWQRFRRTVAPKEAAHVSAWQSLRRFAEFNDICAGSSWWSSGDPDVTSFGPDQCAMFWRLLNQGVSLLISDAAQQMSRQQVLPLSELAECFVAVQRVGAGDLTVAMAVNIGDDIESVGESAVILGTPGVMVLSLPTDHRAGRLARLKGIVQEGIVHVARQREPMAIPRSEQDLFLGRYAPELALRIPVRSDGDDPVHIPQLHGPRLLLSFTHHDNLSATCHIGYRYALDDDAFIVDLGSDNHIMPRDRDAEAALLAEVGSLPVHSGQVVAGAQYRTLLTKELPLLAQLVGVDVEHTGVTPAFDDATDDLRIDVQIRVASHRTDWFDLEFKVRVGNHTVPARNFITAVAQGKPQLELPSGEWIDLTRPELQRFRELIAEARAFVPDRSDQVSISRYQADWLDELLELHQVSGQAMQWRSKLRRALEGVGGCSNPAPAGLRASLRDYQVTGVAWLNTLWDYELGGILADDMGLGKTIQMLAVLLRHQQAQRPADAPDTVGGAAQPSRPVLIVCPTSVVHNWLAEAARFAPSLRCVAYAGGSETVSECAANADVIVVSYQRLRLHVDRFVAIGWEAVVFDEAQMVKNYKTLTYRAAVDLRARRKYALTGTPVENSLLELWALCQLIAPGLLPKRTTFQHAVARPIEIERDADALARLHRRISPFLLRRTKEAVAQELPAKTSHVVRLQLHPTHEQLYQRALARERQMILGLIRDEHGRRRVDVLAGLTRLRRLSLDVAITRERYSGPPPPSAKIEYLVDRLRKLHADGRKALVFSSYTSFLDRIQQQLEPTGVGWSRLDGSTADRPGVVAAFRRASTTAFLISLKAGGTGLTLTEADVVYLCDPWWNPAVERQAVDRSHRIGQRKPVTVYRLISAGTIEEKVLSLQERKQWLMDEVVSEQALSGVALTDHMIAELLG